ncbi:flavin reductase family protein [Longispora albida]|uniref:flavin reductase family protein n=1 Tax=Longispora albida TaxID=203523 RepID=UPI00038182A8|nr:flavin reductase family protein [Longispora albida]
MGIHPEHPFATPEPERGPVRRLRGRLASTVTLWTAGAEPGRAGLPVASTLIADGEPGRVLGLLDPESEVFDALTASGTFAVMVLDGSQQRISDEFAGLVPVPGGAFRNHGWTETEWGPVLVGATTWAGCTVENTRPCGYGELVEGVIRYVELGEAEPLVYHRGRYRTLG